ncbi:MAG: thioredoxin domain-containing protein, partial [Bacteroidia bacterium]|nr:thioredoxin domain-containing protein [Bacteroidia bacterium]
LYTAALFCLICILFTYDEDTLRLARMAMLVMAGAILGSALWFISLQVFVEGTLCKYCMCAHALGIAIAALTLKDFLTGTGRVGWLFAAGVALAAVLAGVQALTAPDYIYQEGSSEADLPVISAEGHPVVGNPDADYVVDLLFDYQCNHCQQLHQILSDVVEALDGRVAFVLCPSPLSPKCNPYIPREEIHFEGSCDFAKLAMSLYCIDKEAFAAFDSWVFENPEQGKWTPKPVADAYLKAAELVPADVLDEALAGDYTRGFLNSTVELFGRTSITGQGGIPRFIYGNKWVVPEADTVEEIVSILASEFGIQ